MDPFSAHQDHCRISAIQLCWVVFIGVLTAIAEISEASAAELPLLVANQAESVQAAWIEINQVIQENEKLKSPSFEPYLVRGEIWAISGAHENAMRDYFTATRLMLDGPSSLAEKSKQLSRIQEALSRVVDQPKPWHPESANRMYVSGLNSFRLNQLVEAQWKFEEACRLDPEHPIYRVYLALVYRKRGLSDDAQREIHTAGAIIRTPMSRYDEKMAWVCSSLEFVQGDIRRWVSHELTEPKKPNSKN